MHWNVWRGSCLLYTSQLTLIEGKIISFLHNNPGKDTAGDIVELRRLSKGNVSLAVENLIRKGLLEREQDHKDRRKIHLSLLASAKPITDLIEKRQNEFEEELFRGLVWKSLLRFWMLIISITLDAAVLFNLIF